MSSNGWRVGGPSPFFTERARERAPRIVDFAAAAGAAILVSPRGDVVLRSGSVSDADAVRIARVARSRGNSERMRTLRFGDKCVQFALVCRGWVLCVLSIAGIDAAVTLRRTERASAVLALALIDGAPSTDGGAPSGAPTQCPLSCRAALSVPADNGASA